MTYDIIASLPGFNKFALIGVAIPAADLGAHLDQYMGLRKDSHYEGGNKLSAVDVHVHPTHWKDLPVMSAAEALAARPRR